MFVVADVHGAFGALARVVASGEPVLVLGDLVNLIDYRTNEGIIPEVIGAELTARIVALRSADDWDEANALWRSGTAALGIDVREAIDRRIREEYQDLSDAVAGGTTYLIHGNVDHPDLLRESLPAGATWVDGEVVEFDGERFGFIGGGVPRIGSRGEVSDDDMRAKLAVLGSVDVLCSHVPPAIGMLAEDVIAGPAKGSVPIREYLEEHRPRLHYFGDVHQPRATALSHGATTCINVGYFRATGRPHTHR